MSKPRDSSISLEHKLQKIAFDIRKTFIQMLAPFESHHIGCSLSIIEILTVLYFNVLRINPKKPKDPDRDIFILSKGHAGGAVYATLAKRGFFPEEILAGFDQNNGTLTEHIATLVPGIEFSTGSLGHGLPVGVGIALAYKRDHKKNRVYVLISDGELEEGSNWEAIMFAGHHKLDNLIVIVDHNHFQGYGTTEQVMGLEPIGSKIKSFKWNVYNVKGHNIKQLLKILGKVNDTKNKKPHFIIAETIKGKGIPYFEGKFESHYKSVDEETKKSILDKLNMK